MADTVAKGGHKKNNNIDVASSFSRTEIGSIRKQRLGESWQKQRGAREERTMIHRVQRK